MSNESVPGDRHGAAVDGPVDVGFELAAEIVESLRSAGHQAFLVGGCVRDHLLGREASDYDIATSATPEEVKGLFRRTIAVGAQFGVMVVLLRGEEFEVATFRSDGLYRDGRRPSGVTFAGPREDVERRDFTINGLLMDPVDRRVIDHIGGREDLASGVIRAIGVPEKRFEEDHLRMLRAVRFAVQLGFRIDDRTAEAIAAHAPSLGRIARERVREELVKILGSPNPGEGFELLAKTGLLEAIFPELAGSSGSGGPVGTAEGLPGSPVARLQLLGAPLGEGLGLAALLLDLGPKGARDAARRLKSPNVQIDLVEALVRDAGQMVGLAGADLVATKKLLRRPHSQDAARLAMVDRRLQGESEDGPKLALELLERYHSEDLNPPKLLDGNDLMEQGLSPGPLFGKILRELEGAQLRGELKSREEALAWLAQHRGDAGGRES